MVNDRRNENKTSGWLADFGGLFGLPGSGLGNIPDFAFQCSERIRSIPCDCPENTNCIRSEQMQCLPCKGPMVPLLPIPPIPTPAAARPATTVTTAAGTSSDLFAELVILRLRSWDWYTVTSTSRKPMMSYVTIMI